MKRNIYKILLIEKIEIWGRSCLITSLPADGRLSCLGRSALRLSEERSSDGHVDRQKTIYSRRSLDISRIAKKKIFSGFIGQAVCLVLASVTSSQNFLVAYLSISIGLGGITWAGFSVNHLDLAPQVKAYHNCVFEQSFCSTLVIWWGSRIR